MGRIFFLVFFLLVFITTTQGQRRRKILVGGLFDHKEGYDHDLAFLHAIEYINEEKLFNPHRLEGEVKAISGDNEFLVSRTVCSLLNEGVVAIFGPATGGSADHVHSMCDIKEIPHIEFRPDVTQNRDSLMINLYPYPPVLGKVYVDYVRAAGWKSFTILYENQQELQHITELLQMYGTKGYAINIRVLDVDQSGNYRPVLKEAKDAGEIHFVLVSSIESLTAILTQAQQVGILSDPRHYLITNPDMHTIDLQPFQHGGANITGIRLVDPGNMNVVEAAKEHHERKMAFDALVFPDRHPQLKFRIKTALIYDAMYLFSLALQDLNKFYLKGKKLSCNETDNWEHGYSVINFMKTKTFSGLTGEVKFDHQGFRSDFLVDLVELTEKGLIHVAVWNSTEGLNITRPPPKLPDGESESLSNKTFVVLISLTEPYGMLKESSITLSGNDRFEGFGIDLIKDLASILHFNFTFKLHPNSVYGGFDEKKQEWTGMIRELMDRRGDLAITDFTITSEREKGVDFTHPFMNLGISILYKKPMVMSPKMFSFASPFSTTVWICLGGAYFLVSITLFVIGRISPVEWTNPYPCVDEPEFLYNQFSFKNCFWFTLGSLMQQGSEIAPIGIATRMMAGLWWFFTLILVSSYTANLAAFLAIQNVDKPISNIDDLANQKVIKYGAKSDGATANFFRDSNLAIYKKIWEHMSTHKDEMTNDNPIGVNRVEKENYAFLMESTSIEYTTQRHCSLMQFGGLLDSKGYGIAMRKNSTYRNVLSAAVLSLQESGRLAVLKDRWWKEKKGGGKCMNEKTSDGSTDELNLGNVGGVFLVLVVGSIGAIFVSVGEMLFGVCNRSFANDVSFKDELITEIKFLVRCRGQVKENTCRKSESSKSLKSLDDDFSANYGWNKPESVARRPSRLTSS